MSDAAGVVGVVGSRDFPRLEWVRNAVLMLPDGTEVVSGGHPDDKPRDRWGVDETAIAAAIEAGLPFRVYAPDPDDLAACGKCAYHKRNRRIAEHIWARMEIGVPGVVLAYSRLSRATGGPTPGTASCLRACADLAVPVRVTFEGVR